MRTWKISANAAFFGRQADGYTEYRPNVSPADKIARVAAIEGVEGIELRYPADFERPEEIGRLIEAHGLAPSAVNVDLKDAAHFRYGALSAAGDAARNEAVRRIQAGMDLAADLGAGIVTTCPLADGFEYPFQVDYTRAWAHLLESVREAAAYRPDVRLVLEYQPHDMQARPLLSNVGRMLHICAQVPMENLGANLDVGHSIAAGESPAEAAALLASVDRLYYMHANDNTGDGGDWDMISGSVHFWEWLELLVVLERLEYTGWMGADIKAHQLDAPAVFGSNTRMLLRMAALLDRMDLAELWDLIRSERNTPDVFDRLSAWVLGV